MLNYSASFNRILIEFPADVAKATPGALAALRAKVRPVVKAATPAEVPAKIATQLADAERDATIAKANLAAIETKRTAAEQAGDAKATVATGRELATAQQALADAAEVLDAAQAIYARAVAEAKARSEAANEPTWLGVAQCIKAEKAKAEAEIEKAIVGPLAALVAVNEFERIATSNMNALTAALKE